MPDSINSIAIEPGQVLYFDSDSGQTLLLIRGLDGQYRVGNALDEAAAIGSGLEVARQLAAQFDQDEGRDLELVRRFADVNQAVEDDWDGFWGRSSETQDGAGMALTH